MKRNEVEKKRSDKLTSIIRLNVVGGRCQYSTPFGKREMVYADYTASGRCLKFLEDYMLNIVSPMYANTHTEASMTGAQTTRLREEARDIISQSVNAPKRDYVTLFTGTGSTGAIDKLFRILGLDISIYSKKWQLIEHIPENERPVVFVSHLEHHSNELIWRHSIARCIVIDEDSNGFPDLAHLERELRRFKIQNVPLIGSFSAGSNVTGIRTPVQVITKLLHRHGAYAFFDYAGVGAYVDIDVKGNGADEAMDAIFLSPHKFIGGPGAAGVLVARRKLLEQPFGIVADRPTLPGGGTVSFVDERGQIYVNDIESREDAGTPGILQCIRAGLVFKVKDLVGSKSIHELEKANGATAIQVWNASPSIALIGCDRGSYFQMDNRVSIISFNILSPVAFSARKPSKFANQAIRKCNDLATNSKQANSKILLPLHYNFVITLLNDLYGIQARGGCSCAGPYGLRLFAMDGESGNDVVEPMLYYSCEGIHSMKLGWARLNLNYFISKDEVAFIIRAVKQIAVHGWKLLPLYIQDIHSGQYFHRTKNVLCPYSLHDDFGDMALLNNTASSKQQKAPNCKAGERSKASYDRVLTSAMQIYRRAAKKRSSSSSKLIDFKTVLPKNVNRGDIWWLLPSEADAELVAMSRKKVNALFPQIINRPPSVENIKAAGDDTSTETKSSTDSYTSMYSASLPSSMPSSKKSQAPTRMRITLATYDSDEEMEC